ncbi:MAG: PHP domain-containing protein [Clostridia bacterium]|nr:PHP domain-containing protein [Clostridia bacterium]
MIIRSDWHVHSEYSYDASTPLDVIGENAKKAGMRYVGITDHVNRNDKQYLGDLKRSAAGVTAAREKYPFLVLGAELTPIEKPLFDYIAETGTRDGFVPPAQEGPYDIMLAVTKQELKALGLRYAVVAAHRRVDLPNAKVLPPDLNASIKEWYRQQMFLAADERVTVLGHPWYHPEGLWYDDFSVIPRGMNADIFAALKENGKYIECNRDIFTDKKSAEKFRRQYAEFLREAFEAGVPVTYGSDHHNGYPDARPTVEQYLIPAGFSDGDFSEISEKDLW